MQAAHCRIENIAQPIGLLIYDHSSDMEKKDHGESTNASVQTITTFARLHVSMMVTLLRISVKLEMDVMNSFDKCCLYNARSDGLFRIMQNLADIFVHQNNPYASKIKGEYNTTGANKRDANDMQVELMPTDVLQ